MSKSSIERKITLNFFISFTSIILIFFSIHYIYIRRTMVDSYIKQKIQEIKLLSPELADYIYINDLDSLKTIISPMLNNPEIFYIGIVNEEGQIIFNLGKRHEKFKILLHTNQNTAHILSGTNLLLSQRIYYTSILPKEIVSKQQKNIYVGHIEVGYTTAALIKQINKHYLTFLPMILGVFLLLFLWLRQVVKSVVNPIINIKDVMREYMEGNHKVRVFLSRTDELGDLAESFNALADELDKKITELENLNRELDKKVNERTKEIQRKNELLRRQNEEIMHASKMKSEFLANISHELRTPLNSILGFSQVLLNKIDGDLNPKQIEDIKIIYQNGKHLLNLINEILDLSKIEAGRIKLTLEYTDVREVVDDVIETLTPLAREKNLYLVSEYSPTIPLIYVDYLRLKQVLLNIVNNGIKFTEEGGVTIKVYPIKRELCIEISDTGIGISHEDLPKIFEAFTQLRINYEKKPSGTGLGLTIAKNYIELMNGRIEVTSEPDIGTTFRIYFSLPKTQKVGRFNIAVVEDDAHAVKLYSKFLENKDVNILHFPYSHDIIDKLKSTPLSLIILDILLPDENGWDILKEIKKIDSLKKIPIIVISVLDKKEQGYSLGADEYLVKPIDEALFIETLKKYLPI